MNPKEDIVFDVTCFLPERVRHEQVRFVNISYEKIQEAMKEAFDSTGALDIEVTENVKEMFIRKLASRLNEKGNTLEWRGKKMKMLFYVA